MLVDDGRFQSGDEPETVPDAFRSAMRLNPEAPALLCNGALWTYADLDALSDRLAQIVARHVQGPDCVVGHAMPRGVGSIVAMLGILKAGAAYLPLDATQPVSRLAFMLRDSGACLLIADTAWQSVDTDMPVLRLDAATGIAEAQTDPVQCPPIKGTDLAYLMYTSGSTGSPKAVAVTHANIVGLAWRPDFVDIGPGQRILHMAPLAFDVSTFEIWAGLLNGACVVLAPPHTPTPRELETLLRDARVDTLWLTAGLLRQLAAIRPAMFASLRSLLSGGDVVSAVAMRAIAQAAPRVRLINGYGPTETTVFATTHDLSPDDLRADHLPIGRALRGYEVYVLDDDLHPVPDGVVGELFIAGVGVARCYWGRPDLTAEQFLPNPFGPSGSRMYRSGDLVSRRPDGVLDFHGRKDQQIKLRGFRIEPGEIEAALQGCRGVIQTFVTDRIVAGEKRLVAYIVGDATLPEPRDLRRHLSALVPDFMIPGHFLRIDHLPLTTNGKVDRAALPIPEMIGGGEQPVGTVEDTLCGIFADLTGAVGVGRHDDFFGLGGDSLCAMRLVDRVEQEIGKPMALATIFETPTPAGLARELTRSATPLPSLLPLRRAGTRRPLFCVHPATGSAIGFRTLAAALDPNIPVWGLQARGFEPTGTPHATIRAMATDYVEEVLACRPTGPYVLVGWSLGGIIAHDMACTLEAMGHEVAALAILDSPIPSVDARDPTGDQGFARDMLVRMSGLDAAGRMRRARLMHAAASARGLIPPDAPVEWAERLLRQVALVPALLRDYAPRQCKAPILLFLADRAGAEPLSEDDYAWEQHCLGPVERISMDCKHEGMLDPDVVGSIARVLGAYL